MLGVRYPCYHGHWTKQQPGTIIANDGLRAKVYRSVKKTHKPQTDSAYSSRSHHSVNIMNKSCQQSIY